MIKAVFPGSFDPPTYGHLDIIRRAASLFDELIVALAENRGKRSLFSTEERLSLLQGLVQPWSNVSAAVCGTLIVDFMRERGAALLVRGVRGPVDFPYEFELALMNKTLAPGIETVFLPAAPEFFALSSSAIKELVSFHRDVSALVPPLVAEALKGKAEIGR
ncbi:MAG: pantetheine-phosphate adenylyltransferase [Treponema sp.]|jgi:pantetheine-phosphate adenylyltransferase|nr:pantetheine-phosphate adenylyltransferase [Treponema sp.]